jgi:hypothetical protein
MLLGSVDGCGVVELFAGAKTPMPITGKSQSLGRD